MDKIFEIAICGAGPVGQTLALLLIQRGIDKSQLVLIDAKTKQQASADKRTIALSHGSQQILKAAHAWPIKATEIHQIHVSRRGHFGRTLIDRNQHQVPALGYVAKYADIILPLSDALDQCGPELTFLRPAKVNSITEFETHATILLEDQSTIQAQIVVQAEGGIFNEQTPQTQHHDYQQSAVIATIKVSAPIAARAYERFTDQGPLALLPKEDGYALVWCVHPDQATQLMNLNDDAFLNELQNAFGERLGKFIHTSQRAVFALGLNAQTSAPTGRVISIGNAAQTLHPVAGQGLNLGLRDAFVLAQFLGKSNSPTALQDFFYARCSDRHRTIQLTDQLAKIFTGDRSAIQSLMGAGLGLVDIFPPAQQWLANRMMFGERG
jgi:2-octaprenyl-6-methoxyphenol hydroxylase